MSLSDREWDDLKALLDKTVQKFLGFSETALVTAALNCIDKGYDKHKTVDKLLVILDEGQAKRFADKLFGVWEDYKASNRNARKKRKDDRDEGTETKRKRRFVDDGPPAIPGPGNPSPGQLTTDKIKEMMQNAQKIIEERKTQLMVTVPSASKPSMSQTQVLMSDAMEKAKRAAELQAMIQNKMSSLTASGVQIPNLKQLPLQNKPTPLILDEEGRTIDAMTGQAVQLQHHTPTLKANIRAKRREQFKGLIEKPPEEISESRFFDSRVEAKSAQRQRRSFKFHEIGKFEQMAGRLRAKAQLDRLQNEIAYAAKKTGIASAAKLATLAPKKELQEGEVPDMEWWDAYVLTGDHYAEEGNIEREKLYGITNLVEHPIQMKPPAEPEKAPEIPVYLTKKERKKLRRQNRQEAQKDEQEKIRLGLQPPPEPKVRMANLMRVLGNEAVQDPTKIEAHVRAQMEKRQKIRDLTNASKKFKIETNAKQLYMTGIVVLYRDCNAVVVEGGPKQQRKFKRLMLHRIKWEEDQHKGKKKDDDDSDSEEESDKTNKCHLVWEGTTTARAFGEMKFKVCPTELFAREHFKKCGVEQYWDLAYRGAIMDSAGDDDL
ncbi:U4/U6 small nuclear ribonucleoprotein Prp3-like isoform X2 [Ylistrum balloti]|uniref:U4/U6 small nuclear ribonucleoprotein Prp3-like isoform X2 n=1 Tax=Ylistrum balloti TaxID=509963 RepID=UPI002905E740|nr:U4/U6 small nuclear ribonucleoprotein Prp3-like isoform X2 [Ylistrum balloti]